MCLPNDPWSLVPIRGPIESRFKGHVIHTGVPSAHLSSDRSGPGSKPQSARGGAAQVLLGREVAIRKGLVGSQIWERTSVVAGPVAKNRSPVIGPIRPP